MIRKALVTSCLAVILGSASLVEAAPPVKVEVLVDDEEDFFEERKSKPKSKTDEVREHADDMFDELAREEAKHNKNQNNNVVNVVVVDGEKEEETTQVETPDAPPEIPEVTVDPNRRLTRAEKRALRHQERMRRLAEKQERRRHKLEIREEKLRLKRQELQLREDLRCQRQATVGWWNRPSWAEQGDWLVHGIGSFNGQGPYGGLGLEYLTTDLIGVRAQYQFMGLRHDDSPHATGPNLNVSNGGTWANPNDVDYRNLREGRIHLIDAGLALHVIPRSRFDLYPTAGISYMNYGFEYGDREEKGGAGYLRLGAGFNIVIKRFYAGLEFGWYPVQIFRHGTDPVAVSEIDSSLLPDRDGDGDGQPRVDDDDDSPSRFNAKRMTLTAHVGLRF